MEVAFDIDEAEHSVAVAFGQQERGQSAHRVPDQVELLDVEGCENGLGDFDEVGDRELVGVGGW